MKDHRVHRKPTERHKKVAAALAKGEPIMPTMLANGYSPTVARLGIRGVPRTVLALMPKETNLIALGAIDAKQQEEIVRGRLVLNTLTGKDSGVNSAKALGSDKRVNMFVADSQVGVIVVNAPSQADKLLESLDSDDLV